MKYTGSETVCALFAYGEDILSTQARARADVALFLFETGAASTVYVTGILGNTLVAYLSRSVDSARIVIDPRGQTTAGEVYLFNSMIPKNVRIISVSSWYHLPRIWLIWLSYGRVTRMHASWRSTSFGDILRELFLLLLALPFPRLFTRTIKSS